MTTLLDAANALMTEIEDLAKWETEITGDLLRTQDRRRELTRSLIGVVGALPLGDRRNLRVRIARLEMAAPRKTKRASIMSAAVAAVHDYLAEAEDLVEVAELQRYLESKLVAARSNSAHTILSRKCRQGMVERVTRGTYRVNPHHPEIANRRFGEVRDKYLDSMMEPM
ncbi:MAG: hypothetical protein AAGD13_20985 [Pseudomonadota bacterium]